MNENDQIVYTDVLLPATTVLKSVKVKGLINSKRIDKIATLNSPLNFDSSLTFLNLEVPSIITDDKISLINVTEWYDNAVWKNGRDTQVITGDWQINEAFLDEDVYGNGQINQKPINEIERNLKINVNAIEMALGNYTGEYSEMCQKLQSRTENYAQNSIYLLKYFESNFKIKENSIISSYFVVKTEDRSFLLVNTKCDTHIYKWNQVHENFTKISTVETGVIQNWTKLKPKSIGKDVFVVTNSVNNECPNGNGLNSWKLFDDTLMHLVKISSDDKIRELHVDEDNENSFYALIVTENVNQVINYDVFGRVMESWILPAESSSYNFLPSGILPGVNLHNGRRIFSLDSRYHRRVKRTFSLNMPEFNERKHSIPVIPSKPIGKTTKRLDFMSKVQKTGEVIRRTMNIETEITKPMKLTTLNEQTKFNTKLSKLKNETNKLLFVINSPNISNLKQNFNMTMKPSKISNESPFDILKKLDNYSEAPETTTTTQATTTTAKSIESSTTEGNVDLRIIMPTEENERKQDENSNEELDRQIEITQVQGSGVRNMENNYIPEKELGEVTVLHVGANNNKRPLYAVIKKHDSYIKGNDFIEVSSIFYFSNRLLKFIFKFADLQQYH